MSQLKPEDKILEMTFSLRGAPDFWWISDPLASAQIRVVPGLGSLHMLRAIQAHGLPLEPKAAESCSLEPVPTSKKSRPWEAYARDEE